MRNYSALSDHDFELLIADLFSADQGARFEAFARGPDQGIDLRYVAADGLHVVQCKHMLGSSFSQLLSSANKEAAKLKKLSPQPIRYQFVTSQSLSANAKSKLREALGKYISSESDIIGAEDLEGYFARNDQVERNHVKLWVSSGAQLDTRLNAATWERSRQLKSDLDRTINRWVETESFDLAAARLYRDNVLIVSGPPGIGKSTLAGLLVTHAALNGFSPVEISNDIEEGWRVIDDAHPQVFYYDDFLGSTFLEDRLAKNEDRRLTAFMRRVAASPAHLLVLTTREHILQLAAADYEEFEREG